MNWQRPPPNRVHATVFCTEYLFHEFFNNGGKYAQSFVKLFGLLCTCGCAVGTAAAATTDDGGELLENEGRFDTLCECVLAAYASELSYDLISSVAPFYYKFSFAEIRDYYARLADSSGVKMLVYHMPAFSGVGMGMDEISSFLGDGRFAGIKYTSNDFFTMERCKALYPEKLIFNGYDEMLLSGLSMGADGGIGSTYNFMADKFVTIRSLFLEGKLDEARSVQNEANRIIAILCKIGVMQAEKEIMNQLGIDFGSCRAPFKDASEESKALIAKEIIPFIKDFKG